MATIREIADLAGVSHATVSNVLNGSIAPVRKAAIERAERVRRIAAQLDYRPDQSARSLRSGRTGMVAVVGDTLVNTDAQNYELMLVMSILAERLEARRLRMSTEIQKREASHFSMPSWKCDAAIVLNPTDPAEVAAVEEAGVPYVSLNGYVGPHGSSVQFDDRKGMAEAIKQILRLGHRRIMYLAELNPRYWHPSVTQRRDAYLDIMHQTGLQPLPGYEVGDIAEDEHRINGQLVRVLQTQRPTAVITYDPYAAFRVLQAASAASLKVPDDLSLLTFNDSMIGKALTTPQLAAMARPVGQIADTIADLLDERLLDRDSRPRQQTVPFELIHRASLSHAPPDATRG